MVELIKKEEKISLLQKFFSHHFLFRNIVFIDYGLEREK